MGDNRKNSNNNAVNNLPIEMLKIRKCGRCLNPSTITLHRIVNYQLDTYSKSHYAGNYRRHVRSTTNKETVEHLPTLKEQHSIVAGGDIWDIDFPTPNQLEKLVSRTFWAPLGGKLQSACKGFIFTLCLEWRQTVYYKGLGHGEIVGLSNAWAVN